MWRWTETVEQYVLDVIFERRKDFGAKLTSAFLLALSNLYQIGVQVRMFLWRQRIFRDHTLGCQVVSIGNLTVGGTGKTPVVEVFARALQQAGRRVAILSRGYKSTPRPLWQRLVARITFQEDKIPPKVVSDGQSLLLDSEQAGDEPYMLASNLKDVVVLVDKDRVKSGRYAIRRFGCDTLLLDDGFQYLSLKSRLDICLIDRNAPFGNHFLLPRGTLREPIVNLKRADYVFITKSSELGAKKLRKAIRQFNTKAEIIECAHHPLYLQDVFTAERTDLKALRSLNVAAISGIAVPESFEGGLRTLGANVIYAKRYADHHRYTQQEIINMINRSLKRGAKAILTTEKDAVRFPKIDRRDIPIYFLRVEIRILSGAKDFDDAVARICHR
ncbi:MAG TPA: tetraacyldisaccharide 4'-kinase [Verrucomicrobiae bacterium]|nr:tetraacyldisaccharide 4'-kinase [Verrucomicrobiae bacterium]